MGAVLNVFCLDGQQWDEFKARWDVIGDSHQVKFIFLATFVCVEASRICCSLGLKTLTECAYRASMISAVVIDAFVAGLSCSATEGKCPKCANCETVLTRVKDDRSAFDVHRISLLYNTIDLVLNHALNI